MSEPLKTAAPLFCDISKSDGWSEENQERLRESGFELVFVPDPKSIMQSLPASTLILPSDVITSCLLRATYKHKISRDYFGELLLFELKKINEVA